MWPSTASSSHRSVSVRLEGPASSAESKAAPGSRTWLSSPPGTPFPAAAANAVGSAEPAEMVSTTRLSRDASAARRLSSEIVGSGTAAQRAGAGSPSTSSRLSSATRYRVVDRSVHEQRANNHRCAPTPWAATTVVLAARDFLAVGAAVSLRALLGGIIKSGNCTQSEDCDFDDYRRLAVFTAAILMISLAAGELATKLYNAASGDQRLGRTASRAMSLAPACIVTGTMALAYGCLGPAGALAVATRVLLKQGYCIVRDACSQTLSRRWWLTEHSSFPGHSLRLVDRQLRLLSTNDWRHRKWTDHKVVLATMLYLVWAVGGQFLGAKLKADFAALEDRDHESTFLPEIPPALTTEIVEVLDVFTIGLAALLTARMADCRLVLDPTPQPTGSLLNAIANNAAARIAFLSLGDLPAFLVDLVNNGIEDEGATPTMRVVRLAAQLLAGLVLGITEPRGWIVAIGEKALAPPPAAPDAHPELAGHRPLSLEVAWQIGTEGWKPRLAHVTGDNTVEWVDGIGFNHSAVMVECSSNVGAQRREQLLPIGDLYYDAAAAAARRREHSQDGDIV